MRRMLRRAFQLLVPGITLFVVLLIGSTHSNQRDDLYGGSLENRSRFLLETLAESIELARGLQAEGTGLAPIAARVRHEANLPVSSAWGIGTPELAQRVLQDGQLDLVMVGRAQIAEDAGRLSQCQCGVA